MSEMFARLLPYRWRKSLFQALLRREMEGSISLSIIDERDGRHWRIVKSQVEVTWRRPAAWVAWAERQRA